MVWGRQFVRLFTLRNGQLVTVSWPNTVAADAEADDVVTEIERNLAAQRLF